MSALTDCTITTPTNTQLLQYDGTKWVNATISYSCAFSGLTDCSTSSVPSDQLLVYTTNSSLNKWTSYTLSGATFYDTN